MKTARLISTTAAVAAGVVLLSPGVTSYASWFDEVVVPGASISSGQLRLNSSSTAVVQRGTQTLDLTAVDTLQVDDVVEIRLAATIRAAGDALSAKASFSSDLADLGNDGVTVDVNAGSLEPVTSGGWLVDESDDAASITATVRISVRTARASAIPVRFAWILHQVNPDSGARTGWSDESEFDLVLPVVASPEPPEPARPEFPTIPVTVDTANNKNLIMSWTYTGVETESSQWQVLQRTADLWEPIEPPLATGTRQFTITDALMKAVPAGATSDFLVRFYPSGSGTYVDSTHAVRIRATSGSSGRMEFVELVPISEGSAP